MAAFPEFYLSDQSTLVSATISESLNAGAATSATTFWLYNDKGGSRSSSVLRGARLVAQVLEGGDWVTQGHPAVDEAWLQVKVTGLDNTGDSTMEAQTTEFYALGANRALTLRDIPDNCGRSIQAKIVAPANASNAASEMRLVLFYDDSVIVLARYVGRALGGSGILPAHYDRTVRKMTGGGALSASGAVVTVGFFWYAYDGNPRFKVAEDVTLNQTAADGALGVGQKYIATLSLADNAASITTTKSNKGAAPTAPATPSGHIHLGRVTVLYQGGGTSNITSSDLDTSSVVYGECALAIGTGLNVKIGVGEAITTVDTNPYLTTGSQLAVTNDASNWIWLLPDGTFSATSTNTRPQDGAVRLGLAVASGGAILYIDIASATNGREVISHEMFALTLRYWGPLSAVTTIDAVELGQDAELVGYRARLHADGGSGSNATVDIHYQTPANDGWSGVTIFTSQATKDYRVVFATGSSPTVPEESRRVVYSLANGLHEVRTFKRGTLFTADIDAVGAGTSEDLLLTLYFRPFRG